jgi:hypothetical protein
MIVYSELLKHPQAAEQFFHQYKDVLPQQQFLTGFNFAIHCDNFHWAFNKYLLSEKKSMYRVSTLVRTFFSDNTSQTRRIALYILFLKGFFQITENMLLDNEYYELMHKFNNARNSVLGLIKVLLVEVVHE